MHFILLWPWYYFFSMWKAFRNHWTSVLAVVDQVGYNAMFISKILQQMWQREYQNLVIGIYRRGNTMKIGIGIAIKTLCLLNVYRDMNLVNSDIDHHFEKNQNWSTNFHWSWPSVLYQKTMYLSDEIKSMYIFLKYQSNKNQWAPLFLVTLGR